MQPEDDDVVPDVWEHIVSNAEDEQLRRTHGMELCTPERYDPLDPNEMNEF